ncbi:MAG: sodium/proline symporter [Bacteroidia bacterium]
MDTIKYVILFIYFAILFVIGYFASKRIKGSDDFFVGGKKLGFWAVSFSSRATGESAWLLLGLTGMGAIIGVKALWVVLGEMLGVSLAWIFMAKPFKRLTDKYDSITVPDYLESHFKPKNHLLRIVAASALAVFVTVYVSAQIDATGQAFESFLNWNYFVGAIVGFVIVLAYSFIGGFVAVVWSDFFQGILMLLGLVALPLVAYINYEGNLFDNLELIDPSLLSWWGKGGFSWINLASIIALVSIGLGFLGAPQVFVRFMSVKNEKELDKGKWVAMAFTLLAGLGAVFIGLFARSLFSENYLEVLGSDGKGSLIALVEKLMPLVIVGTYIAVVLAAIMSTIDSLLVVVSSAITRDFYQKIFHPELEQNRMAKISRNITFIIAMVALVVAVIVALLVPGRSIFWFILIGWSGIAASFCPVIILSLFWKKYNAQGALASMITGFIGVPFFKFIMPLAPGVGPFFNSLEEMMPAFALAFAVGIFVTHYTSKKQAKVV